MSAQNDTIPTDGGESATETKTGDELNTGEAESASTSAARELPLDIVFEIIRNERRRLVLQYLEETDEETVALGELAEHIAAIENDTTEQALSAQQRKRVYVGLYQCHLPKMADSGIVEFNKNRGTISQGPNVDQLEPYLNVDTSKNDGSREAVVLGSVAVVGYALAAFGGFPGVVAGGVVIFTSLLVLALSNGSRLSQGQSE
ncbi:DUF7344 domain-containing protein [Haloarchaeobius litoreus]|uniref:DUF7344 domain-containing protein n=1 Tax=Haloarchaeobius litoreus TaxID=755306 RepID=A0ABD6DN73_9EURY|nr:hypothetical protein [Haloarchaeobius litoreus]